MVHPYSSRQGLGIDFLSGRLAGAKSYDRLAGYFASSVVEIAGEALENVAGTVRVICNSHLNPEDARAARLAKSLTADQAMQREWCESHPENQYTEPAGQNRLARFVKLMMKDKTGRSKLQIKVLPDEIYGLMHGKGGIITYADGRRSSFVGSINETKSAFALNYELAWEDDDPKLADWMQDEFDYFWHSEYAVPLADFIVKDAQRLSNRQVVPLHRWREAKEPRPEQVVVEEPVFREERGLWAHQKYFVELAFRAHLRPEGARFLLADQVGLGKTVQLALAAQLMALYGNKPVLIIVPKTLLSQWQEEILSLLQLPSAIWLGNGWQDERGFFYQSEGPKSILRCPRRVGIVSQGIVTRRTDARALLLSQEYECVVLDEAHRARRRNANQDADQKKAEPNFLLEFIQQISLRTHSLLLATATPVQTHTIEAYDLLTALSPVGLSRAHGILGDSSSYWRKKSQTMLDILCGDKRIPRNAIEIWDILRNPLPRPDDLAKTEVARHLAMLRQCLEVDDDESVLTKKDYTWLRAQRPAIQDRVEDLYKEDDFLHAANPYIRHIVRRTRKTLEENVNPETGRPYLPHIEVRTYDQEALPILGPYADAYRQAEAFCQLLSARVKAGGFLSTMLLKRIGSTIAAGDTTAKKLLAWTEEGRTILADEFDTEMELDEAEDEEESPVKQLTSEEVEALRLLVRHLGSCHDEDPKYEKTLELLQQGVDKQDRPWREQGCIIFSQYFDSARFVAARLAEAMPEESIGLYAGGDKSGLYISGTFQPETKDRLKQMVRERQLRILVGTDAASEGLNLQTLATLINLDLPWNPTRLEQRKGRIQRIGQESAQVQVYNLRYKGSIEDKVHEALSERLQAVHDLFGQVPDTLSDIWIDILNEDEEKAKERIDVVMQQNPFVAKYDNIPPQTDDWSACATVLSRQDAQTQLLKGWDKKKG